MSVLIKGMKKPDNCEVCPYAFCHLDTRNCPIVEIQNHGDLIDRDELKEPVGSYLPLKWTYEYGHIITWEDIITAPAVIPAERGEDE